MDGHEECGGGDVFAVEAAGIGILLSDMSRIDQAEQRAALDAALVDEPGWERRKPGDWALTLPRGGVDGTSEFRLAVDGASGWVDAILAMDGRTVALRGLDLGHALERLEVRLASLHNGKELDVEIPGPRVPR